MREPSSEDRIWWSRVNQPFEIERYDALRARLMAYLQGKDLYVQNCYVGAHPQYQLPIRVINEYVITSYSIHYTKLYDSKTQPRA